MESGSTHVLISSSSLLSLSIGSSDVLIPKETLDVMLLPRTYYANRICIIELGG